MKPAVQVTVALSAHLGLDDQPGELDGHGPIPASVARRIAAEETGTWRRLLTDDRGRLLDYGRSTYRPPKDLAEFVVARDRTCRFGQCNRSARRCDIDHRIRYSAGGETSTHNCQALCPRHHHVKDDDPGWTVQPLDGGDVKWTSPRARQCQARGHLPDRPDRQDCRAGEISRPGSAAILSRRAKVGGARRVRRTMPAASECGRPRAA
jgi:hypothetical protein